MTQKVYDVIVCGGGVSGVCAAIGAARQGASVLILEQTNALGGTWTSGLVAWMLDIKNKKGYILNEIILSLKKSGKGRIARDGYFIYEPEAMKILLDKMCVAENIDIRFHSFVCGSIRKGEKLTAVETVSKSGKESFFANIFIDATGDGDLCALSGASFDIGNDEGRTQPMSLFAIVSGIKKEDMVQFDNSSDYQDGISPKEKLYKEIERSGIHCSQQKPALYYLFNDCFLLTANHQYAVCGTKTEDLTYATIEARQETGNIVDSLRSLGGIWENIRIASTAPSIGVREGRRIKGEYTLTLDDVYNSHKFSDSICDVSFGIDVHALTKDNTTGYEKYGNGEKHSYQIPLRAAKCLGFKNLYMTGRCISGDFPSHASYRVSGNAAVIGENVGRAAAIESKKVKNEKNN